MFIQKPKIAKQNSWKSQFSSIACLRENPDCSDKQFWTKFSRKNQGFLMTSRCQMSHYWRIDHKLSLARLSQEKKLAYC